MAAQNEPPKIPSFKSTRKKESKTGGGPLSSASKTTGAKTGSGFRFPGFGGKGLPNLKVRGLPGGTSVVDRLRNLRKKDLMFIAAGLSVLCMAPVAEHFMMTPEDTAGQLGEGFSQRGEVFPDGTTVYEGGTGGFSPGSLLGQGTDVITPLNVRDPSALVMGPGATRKPEATVAAAPPPKVASKPSTNWKDALAQSAKAGAKKAVKRAALPKPNVKLSGALRGLSSLSGAGSTSAKGGLAPLSAAGVPNKAAGSNALTRSAAAPGYRGAARRSGQSGGGAEGMKAGAGRQGDIMNKGGSSADNLQTSANEAIPMGGGRGPGGGAPSEDKAGKGPGKGNPGDNKSLGESLEFMRRKMEMENAMKLKWKKKEWEEFGRQKMIEESVIKMAIDNILGKGIFEPIGKALGKAAGSVTEGGGGDTHLQCQKPPITVPLAEVGGSASDGTPYFFSGGTLYAGKDGPQGGPWTDCKKIGGEDDTTPAGPGDGHTNVPDTINRPPGAGEVANGALENVNGALGQYCAAPTPQWPEDVCKAVKDMQLVAEERGELKTAAAEQEKAVAKVAESYRRMNDVITMLGAAPNLEQTSMHSTAKAGGLLSTVKNPADGGKGVVPEVQEAKTKLEASVAEGQLTTYNEVKAKLEAGEVSRMAAVGENGEGGALAVAVQNVSQVNEAERAAQNALTAAGASITKAEEMLAQAKTKLDGARDSVTSEQYKTIVTNLHGEVIGTIGEVETMVGDIKGKKAEADGIFSGKINAFIGAVQGDAGIIKMVTEAGQKWSVVTKMELKVPLNEGVDAVKAAATEMKATFDPALQEVAAYGDRIATAGDAAQKALGESIEAIRPKLNEDPVHRQQGADRLRAAGVTQETIVGVEPGIFKEIGTSLGNVAAQMTQ